MCVYAILLRIDLFVLKCCYVIGIVDENTVHNCVEIIVTVVVFVVIKKSSFVTLSDSVVLFHVCKFYTILSYSHIRHLILVKVVRTYLWALGLNYILNSQYLFLNLHRTLQFISAAFAISISFSISLNLLIY